MIKPLTKVLSVFTFCIISSFSLFAQDYAVSPIENFFTEYRDKHKIIFDYIALQTDWTLAQRTAFYETEMAKLKTKFKTDRQAEYESKSTVRTVTNTCTSKSSGSTKKCGDKCVSAPSADLYTQKKWLKVVGDNKGTYVKSNGSTACLKMSVAGKGKNKGTLHAVFRYRPERITALIDKELVAIFATSSK